MEISLAVSYKDKFMLTIHVATLLLSIYSREMKTYAHRKLILDVYCGFILNHLEVNTSLMAFNWLMDKQIIVHPCGGITQSHKRTKTCNNVDEPQMNYAKKPDSKDCILYDCSCMIFHKRQNHRVKNNKSLGVRDWGQGRVDGQETWRNWGSGWWNYATPRWWRW